MRIFLGLGALSLVAGGCLLVTSLDGLEGPPLAATGGGAGSGGAAVDAGSPLDGSSMDSVDQDGAPQGAVIFIDRRPTKDGALKPCPKGIALTSNEVYWVEAQPGPVGILHAPKDGSGLPLHVDRPSDGLLDPFDVGLDNTFLYWSEFAGNVVP